MRGGDFPIVTVICALLCFSAFASDRIKDETVESWAQKLGDELWDLGLSVTKTPEIKASYKKLNARVLPTDGEGILNTIVTNVNNLLRRKMDSVMCIIEAAEHLAEEYVDDNSTYLYYNSKFSPIFGENSTDDEPDGVNVSFYKEMLLETDRHFYDFKVNVGHSAVHVPTDVYDQGEFNACMYWWPVSMG
ncbi:voltage-dependent calcium channel subunit alpha-2/delta-4-like [Cimex lectularius]|uniref:VWA N-terminal domain-containing protein n=1 Tax=Cimex lectularius TaxID=79782 RepID=A0A8I6S8F8_CIMLE|nr:voltage-dependent calcium channel subunit alpha-2/delta-4-like [Cimex lectularius]